MKNNVCRIILILVFVMSYSMLKAQYHEIKWKSRNIEYTTFAFEEEKDQMHIRVCFRLKGEDIIVRYTGEVKRETDRNEWIGEDAEYVKSNQKKDYSPDDFIFKIKSKKVNAPNIIDKINRERDNYEDFFRKCTSWRELTNKDLTPNYLQNFFLKEEPYYARLLAANSKNKNNKRGIIDIPIISLLADFDDYDEFSIPNQQESNFKFFKESLISKISKMDVVETTQSIIDYLKDHYLMPSSDIEDMLYSDYRGKIRGASLKELIKARKIIDSSTVAATRMENKAYLDKQLNLKVDRSLPTANQKEVSYLLNLNCFDDTQLERVKSVYIASRTHDLGELRKILRELAKREIAKTPEYTNALIEECKRVFREQIKLYVDSEEENLGGKLIPTAAEYVGLADNYYWQNWDKYFGPSIFESVLEKYNSDQIIGRKDFQNRLNKKFPQYLVHLPELDFPIDSFNEGIENDIKNSFKSPELPEMVKILEGVWASKGEIAAVVAAESSMHALAVMSGNPCALTTLAARDFIMMLKLCKDTCEETEMEIYDKAMVIYKIEVDSANKLLQANAAKSSSDYYKVLYREYENAYDVNYGIEESIESRDVFDLKLNDSPSQLEIKG